MANELQATLRPLSPLTVIDLKGEVTTFADEAITTAYQQASEQGAENILFNFSAVDYMNSAGISIIIGVLTEARKADQRLLLDRPHPPLPQDLPDDGPHPVRSGLRQRRRRAAVRRGLMTDPTVDPEERLFQLETLYEIGRECASLSTVPDVLRVMLSMLMGAFGATRGLAFAGNAAGRLDAVQARGLSGQGQFSAESLARGYLLGATGDTWLSSAGLDVCLPLALDEATRGAVALGPRLTGAPTTTRTGRCWPRSSPTPRPTCTT